MKKIRIVDRKDLSLIIERLAHQILERNKDIKHMCFIGLQRRGVFIAERIRKIIEKSEKVKIPMGVLDITLYRDDLALSAVTPVARNTRIDFDIAKKTIILVDDVLHTGRTIRAALDEIIEFGRPQCIQLAVLVDRGGRELPIQPDYIGKAIPTAAKEEIEVHLTELEKVDEIMLAKKG